MNTPCLSGSVVAATKKITPNLAIMLPPTSDPEDVKKHVQDLGVDVEQYVVDGVLKVCLDTSFYESKCFTDPSCSLLLRLRVI